MPRLSGQGCKARNVYLAIDKLIENLGYKAGDVQKSKINFFTNKESEKLINSIKN